MVFEKDVNQALIASIVFYLPVVAVTMAYVTDRINKCRPIEWLGVIWGHIGYLVVLNLGAFELYTPHAQRSPAPVYWELLAKTLIMNLAAVTALMIAAKYYKPGVDGKRRKSQ